MVLIDHSVGHPELEEQAYVIRELTNEYFPLSRLKSDRRLPEKYSEKRVTGLNTIVSAVIGYENNIRKPSGFERDMTFGRISQNVRIRWSGLL